MHLFTGIRENLQSLKYCTGNLQKYNNTLEEKINGSLGSLCTLFMHAVTVL
jgi:hypothetical protein